ncbi:MAG: phosphate signaling complex PhoU family protein, partial [Nitriliruptoraceae bacterium]
MDVSFDPGPDSGQHAGQPELRSDYRARLDAVDEELVTAALSVVEAMPGVTRAFLAADDSRRDEAERRARSVAEVCRWVEDQGFRLLARDAPVSGDLRRLVAVLRLVHDVERSARLMSHVAAAVEQLDARVLPEPVRQQLEELGRRATEVLRHGIDAWRRRDGQAIHEIDRLDRSVDSVRMSLTLRAGELDGTASDVLVLGLVA